MLDLPSLEMKPLSSRPWTGGATWRQPWEMIPGMTIHGLIRFMPAAGFIGIFIIVFIIIDEFNGPYLRLGN
jgi:hypothetical protein